MTEIALIAATLAALAVLIVSLRVYSLAKRVHEAADRLNRVLGSEIADAARQWAEAARGVRQATGKLERGLSSFDGVMSQLQHLLERLETHSVAGALMASGVNKLGSWVAGVRRGLAQTRQHRTSAREGEDRTEGQGEPSD
jgi:hypothetical protein